MLGWAIALILFALLMFAVEVFIPSGGLIGLLATSSLIGGILCLYLVDQTAGVIATVIVMIAAPFVLWFFIKYLPDSPWGKRLALNERQKADSTSYVKSRDENPQALVGKIGLALTDLRPSGTCRFDRERLDCLAESGMIEKGTRVVVASVRGLEINVRPAPNVSKP